jgi:predicted permease
MIRRLWRAIRSSRSRSAFEHDMQEELRVHLEQRADDLARSGLPLEEARRRARVEFGSVERYKEELRESRPLTRAALLPGQLWRELVLASRRLVAAPVFTVFGVVSLAIGLGTTTAVYSVMYTVLWPSSGLGDARSLAYLMAPRRSGASWQSVVSRGDFEDLRASSKSFSSLTAWTTFFRPYVDGAFGETLDGEAVTGNAFATVGVSAQLGRPLTPDDDRPGAAAAVMLSDHFWRQTLNADPSVVGRMVRIGGHPFQVVGVAPRSFLGFGPPRFSSYTSAWMPLEALRLFSSTVPKTLDPREHSVERLSVVGRLAPGRTVREASAELMAIAGRLDAAFPKYLVVDSQGTLAAAPTPRGWSAEQVDVAIASVYETQAPFLIVGLVGLVLLVACTNLANLTLARGSARQHEFSVRRALGASRGRLIREQLIESLLLGTAAGALALGVARGLLVAVASNMPLGFRVEIDTALAPGVTIAAGIGLVLALLVFGVWPALQLTRNDVRTGLAGDGGGTGPIRWRTRRSLISAQVAISASFLLVAAMCVRAILPDGSPGPGVDVDRLALSQVDFAMHQQDESRARHTMARIEELAHGQAGIESIAFADGMPFGLRASQAALTTPDDVAGGATAQAPWTYVISGSPSLLRVLGVPVLAGRGFEDRDAAGTQPVVILSEAAAKRVFGTTDVLGRQIALTGDSFSLDVTTASGPLTVVGVARDTDVAVAGTRKGTVVYVPLAQHYRPYLFVVARARTEPAGVAGLLRLLIRGADPDLVPGVSGTALLLTAGPAMAVKMLGGIALGLGMLALVLAMAGLYGVLAHLVARRRREMGIRMALGATASRISRMVLRDGYRPVVVGLFVGFLVGTAARLAFVRSVPKPIAAVDPLAYLLVPIPLALAAFLACYLPARRASRVDPNVALRDL